MKKSNSSLIKENTKSIKRRKCRTTGLVRLFLTAFVFAAVIVTVIIIAKNPVSTKAADSSAGTKYYKSILIRNGDTLWSIADEYMDPSEYSDIREYISEIKEINNLSSDKITYGNHLIVSYYEKD